jgi:muramoyltetrapeptide carboxypeptidase LdcA involved in peptidoglycan recycling
MIIPEKIKPGDVLGVTGTSGGITDELKKVRVENGVKNLQKKGYQVQVSDNVFTADWRGCCGSGKERAEVFNDLVKDPQVKAIFSPAGGDYLMEMLSNVDFEAIKKNPKWFQGYSDNTGLVYPIVTTCDVAAIYGSNFSDFGMETWGQSVKDNLGVLEGTQKELQSYDYFEAERHEYETGLEGYYQDEAVCWKNGRGEEIIEISGRLIGGCFDVIVFLLGTKYDGGKQFVEKYAEDGIIWVLESFNMEDVVLITHLWQMKEQGYFKNVKGFVFGRPLMYNSWIEQDYQTAIMSILGDLDVPVIFDADVGHKGPQFPMVMGSKATITSKDGKGAVKYA